MQNGFVESFNGRMRDELLNETLFLTLAHARVEIAAWVEDYNRERPHSSLGYATPAAFAAELDKQWPAPLRPTGSTTQPIASTALMRNKAARLSSQLEESWGSRHDLRKKARNGTNFYPMLVIKKWMEAYPIIELSQKELA